MNIRSWLMYYRYEKTTPVAGVEGSGSLRATPVSLYPRCIPNTIFTV
jgi:hypothetical protein